MLAKGGGVVDGRLVGVLMGRLWRAVVLAVAVATAVAGFTLVVPRAPARAEVSIPAPAASGTNVAVLSGDFTGDGKTDLAVSGSQYFTSVPVAASAGDGSFTSTAAGGLGDFAGWASVPGVRQVTGDFNGDGKTDIALVPPPGTPWWYTLPVAMSHGDGSFTVTNTAAVGDFTSDWAQTAGARVVSGDFNGDGKTDIALLGAPGWTSIPIAYSNGDGSFGVVTAALSNTGFAGWDSVAGVRVLTGDYNGDGRTDIALVPPANTPWWYTLPVAFATASGSFMVTNTTGMGNFTAAWAQQPGVRALAGDFNGDHKTDIALTGGSGWNSVPVALSNGDGTFTVVNQPSLPDFGAWAHQATNGVLGCVYAGDYNGDGRTDIALPCVITSAGNIFTVPVAFADGHGGFTVTNQLVPPDFGYKARSTTARIVAGDFNGDGKTDLALADRTQATGGPAGLPVAFSGGDGSFNVTTEQVPGFVPYLDGVPGLPSDFNPSTCEHLQFCTTADVNGDHEADQVGFVPPSTQYPGLAGAALVDTGSGWRIWGNGFCLTPQQTCKAQSLGNGDFAADVVQFDHDTPGHQGDVLVALADPANHRFGPLTVWGHNLCPTTAETCVVTNVNADNYIDVVDLARSARPGAAPGSVYAALGTASGALAAPALWGTGICPTADDYCSVGTANGTIDHYRDILQVTPAGAASIAFGNDGTSFGAPQSWGAGLCPHATTCELADLNGDRLGDVIYKDANDHSLTDSQVWVAYGQPAWTYAAPVIFDVSTITTTATPTSPAAPGITLTAATTPSHIGQPAEARSCLDLRRDLDEAKDTEKFYDDLAQTAWVLAEQVALALGASPSDAMEVGRIASTPFFRKEMDVARSVTSVALDYDLQGCPNIPFLE